MSPEIDNCDDLEPLSETLSPKPYGPQSLNPVSLISIVEARKLEHHYPRVLKVKYKES